MSLDIAILGADGVPQRQISISVETHWRMIEAVAGSPWLLARMHDYCEDVESSYEELDALADEMTQLRRRAQDQYLVKFLGDLQELIAAARAERKGLAIISD